MDLLMEILFELYLGLAELIVPEHKFKKWQEVLLKLLCIFVALSILALILAGIILLTDYNNKVAGIACVSVGGALFLMQAILFFIVLMHEHKKEKREKEQALNDIDNDDDLEEDIFIE